MVMGMGMGVGFSSPPPWTPAAIPNAIHWWDPRTQQSTGGAVTSIPDPIGGNTATPAAEADRPAVATINGYPAYYIDGGSHGVPTLASECTTARTIFLVYQYVPGSLLSNAPILGSNSTYYDFSGGAPGFYFETAYLSAGIKNGVLRVNGKVRNVSNITAKPSSPSVITIRTSANVRFDNLGRDRLDSRVDKSIKGDVVVCNAALTDEQIAEIEQKLLSRWGIVLPTRRMVTFAGNSMTLGVGATHDVDDYPTQVRALLTDPPAWDWQNIGIGSQTTTQLRMYDALAIDALPNENRTENVVIIWEGTNDLYFGATVSDALTHLVEYYNDRKNAFANAKVGVGTVLSRSNAGTPAGFEADRLALNAAIKAQFGADAIDIAAHAELGPGWETDITKSADLCHGNALSYGYVASVVAAWINGVAP